MPTITEQKCPCCGGGVQFDAGAQKLKCPYCETEFEINQLNQETTDNVDSINWSAQDNQWSSGETDGMNVYSCQSCGGEIIADSTTGASKCPYCDNPVVMKGQFSGALRPDLVIPFKLDKKAAKEALKKHFADKKFVPKAFLDNNRIEEIKGVYVPHWLFTCDAVGNANFKATKERRWSDNNYNYKETSYYDVYRSGNVGFDNVPVDGSTKMADDLMESVEPFDLSQAADFNTAYLAGNLADKYDVTAEESMNRANERIRTSVGDALAETVKGYDSIDSRVVNMNIANGFYKYALYPVWILNTSWNGEKFTFAMNGQTGKFVGNLPTDKKAVVMASLLLGAGISAVLCGLSFLLGWL